MFHSKSNNGEIKEYCATPVGKPKENSCMLQLETMNTDSSSFNLSSTSEQISKASMFQKLHRELGSSVGGTVTLTPMTSHVDTRVSGRTPRGQITEQWPFSKNDDKSNKYDSIAELDQQQSQPLAKNRSFSGLNPKSRMANSQRDLNLEDCSKVSEDLSSKISIRLVDQHHGRLE